MMKNVENRILYHTHDPRYGQKSAASSKNGNILSPIFLFFILL